MFERRLLDALKIADKLGTWVLYEARDAMSRDYLVGHLLYRVDDIERLRARTKSEAKRKRYTELVGYWRRAARWVASLDHERRPEIVSTILSYIEAHPKHSELPYVQPNSGHPTLRSDDKRPRKAGRPRTRLPLHESSLPRCEDCGRVTL